MRGADGKIDVFEGFAFHSEVCKEQITRAEKIYTKKRKIDTKKRKIDTKKRKIDTSKIKDIRFLENRDTLYIFMIELNCLAFAPDYKYLIKGAPGLQKCI